jgi:RNA polymerase sigma-70 factor (ECF subfamily)
MGENQFILSDQDLWDSFLAGDKKAFELIYEKSISDLYIYGSRITYDHDLVKDCIQDLFVDLHRTRSKIKRTNKILPYLLVSLKRLIIRKLKEQNLDKRVDFENVENLSFSFFLADEENVIKEENADDKMQRALDQLTPRQREAIYLKYVLDLDYQDLAEILNLNYQTTRNLIYRGLQKLRESINGKSILL